jgi:uncharacterized membrane protein
VVVVAGAAVCADEVAVGSAAMSFEQAMENIALGFEVVGAAIIVVGGVLAMLEVLVAADIVKTITVDPSLESVGVLGILVAVRIALSFSLDGCR